MKYGRNIPLSASARIAHTNPAIAVPWPRICPELVDFSAITPKINDRMLHGSEIQLRQNRHNPTIPKTSEAVAMPECGTYACGPAYLGGNGWRPRGSIGSGGYLSTSGSTDLVDG